MEVLLVRKIIFKITTINLGTSPLRWGLAREGPSLTSGQIFLWHLNQRIIHTCVFWSLQKSNNNCYSLWQWLCRIWKLKDTIKLFKYVFSRNNIVKILSQLLPWPNDLPENTWQAWSQNNRDSQVEWTDAIQLAPLKWPFSAEVKVEIEKSCLISHWTCCDLVPSNFLVWLSIYLPGMSVFILYVKNLSSYLYWAAQCKETRFFSFAHILPPL